MDQLYSQLDKTKADETEVHGPLDKLYAQVDKKKTTADKAGTSPCDQTKVRTNNVKSASSALSPLTLPIS